MGNQKLKEYLKSYPLSADETNKIKEMFSILYPDVAEELMRDGNRSQFFTEASCVYEGFKGARIYLEILPRRKEMLKSQITEKEEKEIDAIDSIIKDGFIWIKQEQ